MPVVDEVGRWSLGMSFLEIIHGVVFLVFLAVLTFINVNNHAVLRQDRFMLRQVISQYTLDHEKRPQSLREVVNAGYMKSVPNGVLFDQSGEWFDAEPEIRDSPIPQSSQDNGLYS